MQPTCKNCGKIFELDADDFAFYEKMKVPPPTWCPECQFVRRMVFRNQNALYRRTDNVPGKESQKIISIYSDDKLLTVYGREYWWGDSWDPYSYGMDVDFTRPFFEQMKELIQKVPWPSLMNWNAVNSDYCNCTESNKNCYLVFGGDFNENCSYSTFNMHSRDSQDLYLVDKCDLCYECTDSQECYRVRFAQYSKSCSDCMFVYDCVNCTNCIGCISLRNKSNCIFNEQFTKEEYEAKIKELNLDTRSGILDLQKRFEEFKLKFPHRFAHIYRSVNCTGDNITNGKNCINCFDLEPGSEDLKNVFLSGGQLRDSRNMSHAGHGSELLYDSFGVFSGCQNICFSIYAKSSTNSMYLYNSPSNHNCFGCVGIKNGIYSILNKRYSKEEYEALLPKVIEHMNAMPYIDAKGCSYSFGEFFPPELSPFGYNETIAFEYYPLTKEEAIHKGFTWKDPEEKVYAPTMLCEAIPDSAGEISDDIITQVIECAHKGACQGHQCSTAFKVVPHEIQFYKRLNLPLPNLCPNCRHYMRLRSRNPMQLWHRSCMCEKNNHDHAGVCPNEFETTYAPERKEIIFCESCYQKEVL
jgi:hypothetical protein